MALDVEKIAEIYERYADVVYRRCLNMLGTPEAAMDAVQEIFAKVLSSRATFKGLSEPTTWIYKITTHHLLNLLRSATTRQVKDEVHFSLHPRWFGQEIHIISRDLLANLFNQLDNRSRAILYLHFVDGLDQDEVAQTLGISRRSVVKRLTKIRRALTPVGKMVET